MPSLPLQYDIEADWSLLRTCNFRCDYCYFDDQERSVKIKTHASPEQWAEGFNKTGKKWLIHITGGEPTLYPDFVRLCDELTKKHFISINSNLSNKCIEEFAGKVNPAKINFINAALHLHEREKRNQLEPFIARAKLLQNQGFPLLVSAVMNPQMIASMEDTASQFGKRGLFVIPKVMRGAYKGKNYPNDYTPQEKEIIKKHLEAARAHYRVLLEHMPELPTADMFSDEKFLEGIPDYRTKPCSAGFKFVAITANGTVLRCGSSEVFGNILHHNLKLRQAPSLCNTHYCPYFCEKYTQDAQTYLLAHHNASLASNSPIKEYMTGPAKFIYYSLKSGESAGNLLKKISKKILAR